MDFSKLYKVKEGKLNTIKEWFEVLERDKKEEALKTFEYEQITREIFVLFHAETGDQFVIGLNEVNGKRITGDPEVLINQHHRAVLQECLEPVSNRGEVLLDLSLQKSSNIVPNL